MKTNGQQPVEKKKITFPTSPKKVENPSIGPDGKHKPKRPVEEKQPSLWKKPS